MNVSPDGMKTLVVVNKKAGSVKKAESLLTGLKGHQKITLYNCETESHLPRVIEKAIREGFQIIAAGGGDGTVHSVVNALVPYLDKVRFGIVPLGTGNDFCRSFGVPADPHEAFNVLIEANEYDEERVDLVRVTAGKKQEYCVNVASGGLGGEIEKTVSNQMKERWGALAYARAALKVATNIKEFDLDIEVDGRQVSSLAVLNIIVANARAAGGGFAVAPEADPQDRKLDVVITQPASRIQLAANAAQLLVGDYTRSENVFGFKARHIKVNSKPAMDFSVDGNLFAQTPIEFLLVPNMLRIVTSRRRADEAA